MTIAHVNAPKELDITQKGKLVVIVEEGLDCCWVLLELLQAEARLPRAARREWEEEGEAAGWTAHPWR